MGNSKLLLPFLFLLCPSISAAQNCFISGCRNGGPDIRFPFHLTGPQRRNCGYSGFNLTCNDQGDTVLNTPYSGEFFVRGINYLTQEIHLYDPGSCLPKRLLTLNLSGTPFLTTYSRNYTFLRCPTQLTDLQFTMVDCLSNYSALVLATSSISLARAMSVACDVIVTLPVPVPWPIPYRDGLSTELGDDLQLSWNVPDCRDCETRGGMCGFISNSSQKVGCLSNPGTGAPSQSSRSQVFRIISLSITIPAIALIVAIASFICLSNQGDHRNRLGPTQQNGVAVEASSGQAVTGLDEATIASYTKLVLGESRRIPGPNQGTCAICLSEYEAQEMVRCIPDCNHCFHADCIDEWLRKNTSCPVCRLSPTPASVC